MAFIHEKTLSEAMGKLPDVEPINEQDFNGRKDTVFLCALGFEDRCTAIPRFIAENTTYKCDESIYFEYSTNREDNEINRRELTNSLSKFSSSVTSLQCDSEDFSESLRHILRRLCKDGKTPNVTFDISVCSSKLLLTVLKILFEYDINLQIVYSEALTYHPTKEEVEGDINKWTKEESGLTMGVSDVSISKEHSGDNLDNLPNALIAFLTFKQERIKKIITYLDKSLLEDPNRIIWVIGIPHREENIWRKDVVIKINENLLKQTEGAKQYFISTFDYKETLRELYRIYRDHELKYHINIAPLGSKMQQIGIALLYYMKPDITIVFAVPKKYNADHYSEGCYKMYKIDFKRVRKVLNILDGVGRISLNKDFFGENDENR